MVPTRKIIAVATFSAIALPAVILAQSSRPAAPSASGATAAGAPNAPSPPEQPPARPNFARPDPLEDVKTAIRATDEEWKVIGPLVRQVALAQSVADTGTNGLADLGFGTMFRPFGPRGRDSFSGVGAPAKTEPANENKTPAAPTPGNANNHPPAAPPPLPPPPPARGLGGEPPDARPRGPRGGGGGRPPGLFGPNAVSLAIADLRAAAADAKSTPAQLQEKIAAVHRARQQAQADLAAAQKELLEMLAPDQEAVLVSLGYLD